MEIESYFVRVYRMPEKLTNGFCFGAGMPIIFTNVDWFQTGSLTSSDALTDYIKSKVYYSGADRFLVQSDHPEFTYMIDREQRP